MDSDKLNTFRAVAKERGFSRAAHRLHRTQPAVSQAIRLLEEEIGEPLFLRLGRTIRLTQAGQILLEHAEQTFEAMETALVRIAALKKLREGTLTITASDTTACYLLPPVLGRFRRRYPGVEVRILNRRSPEAAREVETRAADVGIITLPDVPHPALTAEPLIPREDVAICASRHPLAKRRKVSFADLLDYPLLLLDSGSNTRSFIDRRIAEAGKAPRIAMELGAIEVVKELVKLDFGVSIVPRIAIRAEARAGALHAFRVFHRDECRMLGIIRPARGVLPLSAQTFVEMVRRHLNGRDVL
jgi:DNA-binding transcriptional LysR family regulator